VIRALLNLLGAAVLVTVVFVALLLLQPFSRATALHLYLLVLAGLLLLATVMALPARGRSLFEQSLRPRAPQPTRPPQLERVERAVTLGVANSFDLHARLRPLLREVAAARLASARGVELDSPAGRALVGEEAWELLRPDRGQPTDRFAAGVGEAELRRLVALLEAL
jgi:uncharacterized protein YhhL (DUF1145 family)